MDNPRFISLVQWLRSNWCVTSNVPYGYFGIDNRATRFPVEMSAETRQEYFELLIKGNSAMRSVLNKRFSDKEIGRAHV